MKTKLLTILALSAMVVSFSAVANAAEKPAKTAASAQACIDAKTVSAKHALHCKLTKEEKAELKKEKKAEKHS